MPVAKSHWQVVTELELKPNSQLLRVDCVGCYGYRDEKQAPALVEPKGKPQEFKLPQSWSRQWNPKSSTRPHQPWKVMRMCF